MIPIVIMQKNLVSTLGACDSMSREKRDECSERLIEKMTQISPTYMKQVRCLWGRILTRNTNSIDHVKLAQLVRARDF